MMEVEQFRTDTMNGDRSFHSTTEKLCHLFLQCPTFKGECETQTYIWSQIEHINGVNLWEDRIKIIWQARLEMLPKKQIKHVGELLNEIRATKYTDARNMMAMFREMALCDFRLGDHPGIPVEQNIFGIFLYWFKAL